MMRACILILVTALGLAMIAGCGGGDGPPPPRPSYSLYGLCFSPFLELRPGADVVTPDRIRQLLTRVAPYTDRIYLFGTSSGLDAAPAIAKDLGLQVYCGAWLSPDPARNEDEIRTLIGLLNRGTADVGVVGPEVLLRQEVTEQEVVTYIRRVRNATGKPVAYSDVYNVLLEHPAVLSAADEILMNTYPFHEQVPVERAMRSVHCSYQYLRQQVGAKPLLVGETGWPSGGTAKGEAVPSPANAARYFMEFVSWARSEGVGYFYFEAYDEPHKVPPDYNEFWGVWDFSRTMKPDMARVFAGRTVLDNWTPQSPASIEITYAPPVQWSVPPLEGLVHGICPFEHYIAVWLEVPNGWWPKPTFAGYRTPIRSDGHFAVDIIRSGIDDEATRAAVFLFPDSYTPPSFPPGPLPPELCGNALAGVEVTLSPGGGFTVQDLCGT